MKEIAQGLWISEEVRKGKAGDSVEDKAFYITYKDEILRKDVHVTFRFLIIGNAKSIDKAWVYALKISRLEYTFR